MSGKIAVFGTGPAGIFAAYAAIERGYDVVMYSNTSRKSPLYGCQYLHEPVIDSGWIQSAVVRYELRGTAEGYRRKVYGDAWEGMVSPDDLVGEHKAWDIRKTYSQLFTFVGESPRARFEYADIDGHWVYDNYALLTEYDLVISTIPARALCGKDLMTRERNHPYLINGKGHEFRLQTVIATGSREPGTDVSNFVLCDGTSDVKYYRHSRVFGYQTTEWPFSEFGRTLVDNGQAVYVHKPLSTDCNCWPMIRRVGRYGKWDKSQLTHHAYNDARRMISEL